MLVFIRRELRHGSDHGAPGLLYGASSREPVRACKSLFKSITTFHRYYMLHASLYIQHRKGSHSRVTVHESRNSYYRDPAKK